jgi:adenosylcobyric acid synthase
MTDDILPLEDDDRFEVQWRRHCVPSSSSSLQQDPDTIILPGSRQTRIDMDWLTQSPWYEYLHSYVNRGGKILGLCGGYQMLGQWIADPHDMESRGQESLGQVTKGLQLLPVCTTLETTKVVQEVRNAVLVQQPNILVNGFEIHSGQTVLKVVHEQPHCHATAAAAAGSAFLRRSDGSLDGWEYKNIAGTYLHGILASSSFRQWYFGLIEQKPKNDSSPEEEEGSSSDPLDRLATHLINHGLTVHVLHEMMGVENHS